MANRINTLAAEIRRVERRIAGDVYDPETGYRPATDAEKYARGDRLSAALAEPHDKHAYWTAVRTVQVATGTTTNYSKETIRKGDQVRIRGHWRGVIRVNTKTVSVTTGYSWTDTTPYAEIQAHRRPTE